MSMTRFCGSCGASNSTTAQFCHTCGASLALLQGQTGLLPEKHLLNQRYLIISRVGQGGMGAVYKATDLTFNRLVAIKEMSQSAFTPQEHKEAEQAFQREGTLLARLKHAHLPGVYDAFSQAGRSYLVMDFVEGETLEEYQARMGAQLDPSFLPDPQHPWRGKALAVGDAIQIAVQLCDVLDYLHSHRPPIIFRDLKPSNVMRDQLGTLFLIDFGIARFFVPGQAKDTTPLGSSGYAAFEQYGREQTSPRSDIYSLGAVLHSLLTGVDPSDQPFFFKPASQINPTVPLALEQLLSQMVERDPFDRPESVRVVRTRLEQAALAPSPVVLSARPGPAGGSSARPDASIFVISAPLVVQPGTANPEDVALLADIRAEFADLEQAVRTKRKRFAYRDETGQGKLREQFAQFLQEATIVLVVVTPTLLASPRARELVEQALDERDDRLERGQDLLVLPVIGRACDWRASFPPLGRGRVWAPYDGNPLNGRPDRARQLQKLARDIGEKVVAHL